MDKKILNIDIQKFIDNNLSTDIVKLILKGSPFSNISIQEIISQIESKKKSIKKLPNWFLTKNIYFPNKLSIEQSSSEITAKYKSNLVLGKTIVDLTGGFGVDTYYFSKFFDKIIYCEINKELAKIVSHNFKIFKIKNVNIKNINGINFLEKTNLLFDCIYIDPSRRNNIKEKVFLIEHCIPNIYKHLNLLFLKTNTLIIKNSPMLDIASSIEKLKYIKEIHIIAVKNEVKELLFLLKKNFYGKINIKTININNTKNQFFNFIYKSESKSIYSEPLLYLYEPNAAILKSGGFNHISEKFKIKKLHEHSHLYTSNNLINFPGRIFKINDFFKYDKKVIKQKIKTNKANITIRNFKKTVSQIRHETKLKDGGSLYLFCTQTYRYKLIVISTSKVK